MTDTGVNASGTRLTHRRVVHIALPIVIANASVPILGVVDTGVVGQLGEAAPIGAVGLGAVILSAVYWVFGFLRMGTVGLTSQAIGKGDRAEVDVLLSRALLIGLASGLALIALQMPLIWAAFKVAPASAEVETLARSYMSIRIWSAPAAIGLFAVTGWLIAAERTRAVLLIQLVMNGMNIALNLWFVLGLNWGVQGVAIASFLSEWSGLLLGLWVCRSVVRRPHWCNTAAIFNRARLMRMAVVNRDILIRTALLEAMFVSFTMTGAKLGDVPLAANQVLLQFMMVTAYAMDGFAFAAETLVGQAMGARRRMALRRSALLTSFWAAVICIALSACFALAGGSIIDLMTTSAVVRIEAHQFLIYMVFTPLVGCAAWMFDGIFVGATRTVDMRNMMIVSTVIYAVALLALVPIWGNHGLWMALLISFAARGITLGLKYPALEAAAEA